MKGKVSKKEVDRMEKIIGISEDDVKGYVFVKEVNDFNVLLSEVL